MDRSDPRRCLLRVLPLPKTPPPYVFSGPLLPLLLQMPENTWLHANANLYSNVWTSPSLEPLDGCCTQPPSKIIVAWSGFAWDSNRGDLILWGGGHANYPGNDVYRWHSSTLLWERASLPSEIQTDPVARIQSPSTASTMRRSPSHTYDNNLFLPMADRFLTWGGAAYDNGGPFIRPLESNPTAQTRLTGPYLFDPNRADGNKVGGSTGSQCPARAARADHRRADVAEPRHPSLARRAAACPAPTSRAAPASATEGGLDVVYVASANPVRDQPQSVSLSADRLSRIRRSTRSRRSAPTRWGWPARRPAATTRCTSCSCAPATTPPRSSSGT